MSLIDQTFNEKNLKALQLFEMVIACFVKGDLKDLLNFIGKLIKNFQSVIDERLEEQNHLKLILLRLTLQIKDQKLKNFLRLCAFRNRAN